MCEGLSDTGEVGVGRESAGRAWPEFGSVCEVEVSKCHRVTCSHQVTSNTRNLGCIQFECAWKGWWLLACL